eukprot:1451014-Rhodomonas_salina.2
MPPPGPGDPPPPRPQPPARHTTAAPPPLRSSPASLASCTAQLRPTTRADTPSATCRHWTQRSQTATR